MAEYKLVLNDTKTGKSFQREVKDAEADYFKAKKLGDNVSGDSFGLAGYEFEITGGSDRSGFPMRKDVSGDTKNKILAVEGVGLKKTRKGMRVRKTVAGNTVGNDTIQINLKITKYGKEKLGGEEEVPAEGEQPAAKSEAPKEEAKAETKPEEKPADEPKKEEPAEKKKEEPKEEKTEEKSE